MSLKPDCIQSNASFQRPEMQKEQGTAAKLMYVLPAIWVHFACIVNQEDNNHVGHITLDTSVFQYICVPASHPES